MAQLVEQRIRNAWVGSSSLPIGIFVVCKYVWYNEADGWFYCEGVIWNKQAIDLVKNQGWSVSCTYDFESDFKKGTYHGKDYDMEFTNGEFLHLALVPNPRYERATIVMNSKDTDKELLFLEGLRDILANHKHYSESDLRVVNELKRVFNSEGENSLGELQVQNNDWKEEEHPRYPKGTPRGGQFAKIFTEKDGIPDIDEVKGLRSAVNTELAHDDCEGILKGRTVFFDYASARFKILINGYDSYKIKGIIIID